MSQSLVGSQLQPNLHNRIDPVTTIRGYWSKIKVARTVCLDSLVS